MKTLFATTILLGSLAFPAFAQMADDMSCADFMAMDFEQPDGGHEVDGRHD
jgi:hypothetical protein